MKIIFVLTVLVTTIPTVNCYKYLKLPIKAVLIYLKMKSLRI